MLRQERNRIDFANTRCRGVQSTGLRLGLTYKHLETLSKNHFLKGLPLFSQAWADAFRSSPDLTGVVHIYEELKRKGVEFPMADLDALSPIHTPQRVSFQLAFSRKTDYRTGEPSRCHHPSAAAFELFSLSSCFLKAPGHFFLITRGMQEGDSWLTGD
jgi:hypothetical protein